MPKPMVQIGGKVYDAKSGKLLKIVKPQLDIVPSRQPQLNPKSKPSSQLPTSKSSIKRAKPATTLNRQFVKDPIITPKPTPQIIKKRTTRPDLIHSTLSNQSALRKSGFKSRQIRRFMSFEEAKKLNSHQPVILAETTDSQFQTTAQSNQQLQQTISQARQADFLTRHRMQQIAKQRQQQQLQLLKQTERILTGQSPTIPQISPAQAQVINTQIKRQTLLSAIANDRQKSAHQPKQPFMKRHASLLAGGLAMIVLGIYLTYLNMPNISIRVAASQAGINASYPEYKPSGYSIKKLATFENNQVVMEYHKHNKTIKLTQQASDWDSKTILENIVKKQAGESYHTDQTKGLTIYNYPNHATWVNGGILYNLTFDDNLPIDQIHKIATSFY